MKKNIRCIVMYDGTNYDGWQRLANKENNRSIQHILEVVLSELLSCNIKIHGSGRTDKGVHAMAQVFHFHYEGNKKLLSLYAQLNQSLPEDIRILRMDYVDVYFHSRLSAIRKTYEYRLVRKSDRCVFSRKYTYEVEDDISIDKMREASKYLIGTYDFRSFSTERKSTSLNKKDRKSTIRTIENITIDKICNSETYYRNQIRIQVTGNGFLYNMVRIIVGTLIEIGTGKKEVEDMKIILDSKERKLAGAMANYEGLFLKNVEYS